MAEHKPTDFVNDPSPLDIITKGDPFPPKSNRIYKDVIETIGNTPLIRLNKVPQAFGVKCEILVKCEYFNPGGSIKDRIAVRMIADAEKAGRLKEGGIIVEPSSGNTAIALGMVGGLKGYKTIITLPDKNEGEKVVVMKALGLDIIKTASAVAFDDPASYFCIAKQMSEEIPGAITLNQYSNISNGLANYDTTGEEILEACENKIDYFVAGTGTGGTMTGISAKLKERVPTCKVVGVDPVGSLIAEGHGQMKPYKVEGLGHDFTPNTCVKKYVDHWVKTTDQEAFDIARKLIKDEGLLIGSSCGSAVWGAIKFALDNNLNENQRMVVLLPDSIRNYCSKFANDDYLVDWGFLPVDTYKNPNHKLFGKTVKDLGDLKTVRIYNNQLTVGDSLKLYNDGESAILVEKNGTLAGAIFETDFQGKVFEKNLPATAQLKEFNPKKVPVVDFGTDLSIVSKFLERHKFILVAENASQDAKATFYKVTPKELFALSL